jgi:hypothetical protein
MHTPTAREAENMRVSEDSDFGLSAACPAHGVTDDETLARALLARAATAPDPAPLIEAARTLLAQAKSENVTPIEDARKARG